MNVRKPANLYQCNYVLLAPAPAPAPAAHNVHNYTTIQVGVGMLTYNDSSQQSNGNIWRNATTKKRLSDVIGESQAHDSVRGRPVGKNQCTLTIHVKYVSCKKLAVKYNVTYNVSQQKQTHIKLPHQQERQKPNMARMIRVRSSLLC